MNKHVPVIILLLAMIFASCGDADRAEVITIEETPTTPAVETDPVPVPTLVIEIPDDLDPVATAVAAAPTCDDLIVMTVDVPQSGCLHGGSLVVFADFGCAAYSDHGGGFYDEPYQRGAAFSGCPTD